MPALEYTMEVTSPLGVSLPDAEEMATIVHEALERRLGEHYGELIDVEVIRVSDDL